jgi:hypothetical protein
VWRTNLDETPPERIRIHGGVLFGLRASPIFQRSSLMLLIHRDHNSITAQAQHQAGPLRLQVHYDSLFITKPQVACARVPHYYAVTALCVGTGEVLDLAETLYFALSIDRGCTDPADLQPAHGKCVGLAIEV